MSLNLFICEKQEATNLDRTCSMHRGNKTCIQYVARNCGGRKNLKQQGIGGIILERTIEKYGTRTSTGLY
jgi:hypothetical protein